MKPGTRARGAALGAALAATLAAAWFAPPQADEGVRPVERTRTVQAPAAPAPRVAAGGERRAETLLALRPREGDDAERAAGVFDAAHWIAPPAPAPKAQAAPPVAAASAAPPPQAPPLPFRVLGRFTEDGGSEGVFLQHNDQNLVVRVGDTIAEHYKVEGLDATSLVLRYGPMNQVQTLAVGVAK